MAKVRRNYTGESSFFKLTPQNRHRCPASSGYVQFKMDDERIIGLVQKFNPVTRSLIVAHQGNVFMVKKGDWLEVTDEAFHDLELRRRIKGVHTRDHAQRVLAFVSKDKGAKEKKLSGNLRMTVNREVRDVRGSADNITYEYNFLEWIKENREKGFHIVIIPFEYWVNIKQRFHEVLTDGTYEHVNMAGHIAMRKKDFLKMVTANDVRSVSIQLSKQEDGLYTATAEVDA